LLRNVTPGAEIYIDIKPELENCPNRNAIGAKVEVFKAGQLWFKNGLLGTNIISVSNGYSCGNEAIAHFELPNDKTVDIRLTMHCNGKIFTATAVKRNQIFVMKK